MAPKRKQVRQRENDEGDMATETTQEHDKQTKKLRTEPLEEPTAIAKPQRTLSSTSAGAAAVTEESVLAGTVPFVRRTVDKDFNASTMLKFVSWNVAGLRAMLKKEANELHKLVAEQQPDVLCLQETKLSDAKDAAATAAIPGYRFEDSLSTAKKGYSGTRIYVRDGVDAAFLPGFDVSESSKKAHDEEGRVLTALLCGGKLALLNSYVPNSGMTLDRLDYRTQTYDVMMRKLLRDLQKCVGGGGGVVWTGDLNVAERDYDRYFASNFKAMQKVPGFTPEERASFRQTLRELDLVDSFRHLYPNAHKAYTFWSAKFESKKKGNGWRLDYFVVSKALATRIVDSFMLPQYVSSDHCPIVLWLKK